MNSLRPIVGSPALKVFLRECHHHGPKKFKGIGRRATMNDLPIPNGSWQADHAAQQTKYNMHLAFGIIFATITAITVKSSGLVFFNYAPPPYP